MRHLQYILEQFSTDNGQNPMEKACRLGSDFVEKRCILFRVS
jgi:hypothetical protein